MLYSFFRWYCCWSCKRQWKSLPLVNFYNSVYIHNWEPGWVKKMDKIKKCQWRKITLLVGVIVSLLMGILFVNNTANNANELVVVMLITLSGIVFSLIIGFGLTFYIDWFKRQSGIIRALSIIFYPITIFIFYFVGLGGMILYSIKILKNNK